MQYKIKNIKKINDHTLEGFEKSTGTRFNIITFDANEEEELGYLYSIHIYQDDMLVDIAPNYGDMVVGDGSQNDLVEYLENKFNNQKFVNKFHALSVGNNM
jgi:hypothetical protein